MSTSKTPDSRPELNVVERGGYSETGGGPAPDTTGYYKATPAGVDRDATVDGSLSQGPRRVGSPTLARDKLARSGPPQESFGSGGVETWHLVLALCLIPLGIGGIFALWLLVGGELSLVPPPPERVEEGPKDLDGIPVQRGIKR